MAKDKSLSEHYDLYFESRLTKVEANTQNLSHDIKDIKNQLRWLTGLIITLNTSIIGLITKGFGVF